MKRVRIFVLGLSLLGGCATLVADDIDEALKGLQRVAIEGNYEYPLRLLAYKYPQSSDPRIVRFKAALARARENALGAAAAGPVPPETATAELPEFPAQLPTPGQPFTTGTAHIGMVWIPPGKLLMSYIRGSDDDTLVTLTHGYWLGRTEVTQAQWAAVMDNQPRPSRYRGANRPVEQVSWISAVAFCEKLTAAERAAGRLPRGYGYSLPSEAQWEYACRAGGPASAPVTTADAWSIADSDRKPHVVGLKRPNAWGLYDMHGNVWEWCIDGYTGYPGGEVTDLQAGYVAPSAANFRILRGGGFMSPLGECRADYREWNPLGALNPSIGLRVALVNQPATPPRKPDGR